MPNSSPIDQSPPPTENEARPRRALIIAGEEGLSLEYHLKKHVYVPHMCTLADAPRTIKEFEPDVVLIVIKPSDGEADNADVALARKLRADTATYSLPIVFVWREDQRSVRAAVHYAGADDYFPLATPPDEIVARLESLFWRVESDRRSSPVMSDQRLEIDNFMFMLDAVREALRAHEIGTLALIYAVSTKRKDETLDRAVRDRTLIEAHNFFRLNLRRIDAVAYYGPTTLLVYLPRMDAESAAAALSRLHREFRMEHPGRDMVAGVASFPAHGKDAERLIERAEEAVNKARREAGEKHVISFEPRPVVAPDPEREPLATPTAGPQVQPSTTRINVEVPHVSAAEMPAPTNLVPDAPLPPNSQQQADRASVAAAHERDRRASGAIMPRRLLLTVSDANRMTQLNSLIRAAGYEARAAFSGQQALDLLKIERQDLLLLDYELQGIDGLETIRRLRKQGGGRLSLPVILLLATKNDGARREALELGARSVHEIPYDPAELLASLRLAGGVE